MRAKSVPAIFLATLVGCGGAGDDDVNDAGATTDSGAVTDASVRAPDSGVAPDSGALADSGASADAGAPADSGETPDAGPVDSGQPPDSGLDPNLTTGEITFRNFATGGPADDIRVSVDDRVYRSDSSGVAQIQVTPYAPFKFIAQHPTFMDLHYYGEACGPGCDSTFPPPHDDGFFNTTEQMVPPAVAALVGNSVGIPVDTARGHVFVSVLDGGNGANPLLPFYEGVAVELDSSFGIGLTRDNNAPGGGGLRPGQVTVDDAVIFFNVATGTTSASIVPPVGTDRCSIFPSKLPTNSTVSVTRAEIEVFPNSITRVSFACVR